MVADQKAATTVQGKGILLFVVGGGFSDVSIGDGSMREKTVKRGSGGRVDFG